MTGYPGNESTTNNNANVQPHPPTYNEASSLPTGPVMYPPPQGHSQPAMYAYHPQQYPPQPYQGQPGAYPYPVYSSPQTVYVAEPSPTQPNVYGATPATTTTTVVYSNGTDRFPGDEDIFPTLAIFVVGWFGLCCVWLGGLAYYKSRNPTARMLAWSSIVMYGLTSLCFLIWIIYVIAISAVAANSCISSSSSSSC